MSSLINFDCLGIEGFKKQGDGQYFVRIKIPAGVLSAEQADKIADVAEKYAAGGIHLTIRGGMEIHRLAQSFICDAYRELKSVGLELRGATGGSVRSVSCSSVLAEGYPQCQVLAGKIQRHFTGNPYFEGVPKKFKIGVESCYQDACHLIQDVCLVYSGESEGEKTYDIWVGGGLGKMPVEAFLYRQHLPEKKVIPVIEAVLEIYMAKAQKGKRLKTLIQEEGQDNFLQELDEKVACRKDLPLTIAFDQRLTSTPAQPGRGKVVVPVRFGQLSATYLRTLSNFAQQYSEGFLVLTPSQNVAFFIPSLEKEMEALDNLRKNGYLAVENMRGINFRTCPGSHECPRGLTATREVGEVLIANLNENGRALKVALAGCPNSCVRPQTADIGIVTKGKGPKFDVYRCQGETLGKVVHRGLDLDRLLEVIRKTN
jgi:sulfite reductase beta subunit-like hemoprotein